MVVNSSLALLDVWWLKLPSVIFLPVASNSLSRLHPAAGTITLAGAKALHCWCVIGIGGLRNGGIIVIGTKRRFNRCSWIPSTVRNTGGGPGSGTIDPTWHCVLTVQRKLYACTVQPPVQHRMLNHASNRDTLVEDNSALNGRFQRQCHR